MAKLLAELLNEPESKTARRIAVLEQGAGFPSIDVRLIAEIRQSLSKKIKSLGLDNSDTTIKELHWSLRHKILKDEELLLKTLKLGNDEYLDALLSVFNALLTQKSWLLKRSTVKKLISANPPKKVMKFLHFRSIASMLKNCPVDEIWYAAAELEDSSWSDSLTGSLTKLKTSDFEYREIKALALSSKYWTGFHKSGQPQVWPLDLLGSIVVSGKDHKPQAERAELINLIVDLVAAYNHIRCVAAYLSFHQTSPNFSNIFVGWPKLYNNTLLDMAGTKLNWEKIIHLADQPGTDSLLEAYDPQLSIRDTELIKPEVLLVHMNVGFEWWLKTSYLGASDGKKTVSLNIADVCKSVTGAPQHSALRYALNTELLARYAACRPYLALHLNQLDNLEPPHQTKINKRISKSKKVVG